VDLLTAVLTCSLYFDDHLVRAIINATSAGNSHFVGYIAPKAIVFEQPTSLEAARGALTRVVSAGGRPSLGLMGVPAAWAERFGKRPDQLFDDCLNIAVGTSMLTRFEAQCRASLQPARGLGRRRPLPREILRPCILGHVGREFGIANFAKATIRQLPSPGTGNRPLSRPRPADLAVLLEPSSDRSLFFDESPPPPAAPTTPDDTDSPILR
jgi:hypothetical protein